MNLDYKTINKALWNKRTESHIDSDFYDNESFMQGRNSLNEIEMEFLTDIKGKSILHLQCHFGQDSISLARLGAMVTGADISDASIKMAEEMAAKMNVPSTFICSDLYELPNVLNQKFDMVFTSYGTIGWLPDVEKWASVVSHFLKPGGHFVMADFHPVVWMYDDDFKEVTYRYFNAEPIIEQSEGSYADTDSPISLPSIGWNHGMAEILSALMHNNVQIKTFREYDYSPYPCFRHTEEFAPNKFRIKHFGDKIPMVYAIVGERNG